jgi:hypothetical protein
MFGFSTSQQVLWTSVWGAHVFDRLLWEMIHAQGARMEIPACHPSILQMSRVCSAVRAPNALTCLVSVKYHHYCCTDRQKQTLQTHIWERRGLHFSEIKRRFVLPSLNFALACTPSRGWGMRGMHLDRGWHTLAPIMSSAPLRAGIMLFSCEWGCWIHH